MDDQAQDDEARRIGMTPSAFAFVQHELQQRSRPVYIGRILREQFNQPRLTHVQLADARQWFKDHPDPYYSIEPQE